MSKRIYNPEDYVEVYRILRERWNYSPTIIKQVCRIAEGLKKAGFSIEDIKHTDKMEITEKYLQHRYENRNSRDMWIRQAISRYQECLIVGGL